MMQIFFKIFAVLVSVLSVGCMNDLADQTGKTVVTVGLELTRTCLGDVVEGSRKVYWSDGDQITINGVPSKSIDIAEGKTYAKFSFDGDLFHPFSILYPAVAYVDDRIIRLPAVQAAAEGTFATNCAPMAGYATEGDSIQLHHVAGVIRLQVKLPAEDSHDIHILNRVEFRGNDNEQVSGDFTIDYQNAEITSASASASDRGVAVNVHKALSAENCIDIFVVVPAISYENGFTVRLINAAGHYMEIVSKALTVGKGEIKAMPVVDFVPSGTIVGIETPDLEASPVQGLVCDSDGNPLEGVVVSDCYKCVETDKFGRFELNSDLDLVRFVYVSIPSGYAAATNNGLPVFYKRLSDETSTDGCYHLDFVLEKMQGDPDRYSVLMVADPQPRQRDRAFDNVAYHSLDCCNDLYRDMRETGSMVCQDRQCYAIVLGDIVHEDMTLFEEYINRGTSMMGFPVFNVIGNHDHDAKSATDEEGAWAFEEKFGPSNYSFNLGKVHYVVVDDMIQSLSSSGSLTSTTVGLRDDIMEWVKSDLSFVDESSTIMICMHSPMFLKSKSSKNRDILAAELKRFGKVHEWSGHVHNMDNNCNTDLQNLEAHCIVRATGELWTNEYLSIGVPRGYVVVDVDGKEISWKFKPIIYQSGAPCYETPEYDYRRWDYVDGVAVVKSTGRQLDDSYQMNVYPRGAYGDDCAYANVFMWDQKWDTPVYVRRNGVGGVVEYPMIRVTDSNFKYDIASREIYDYYKENSWAFDKYGSYSWNTDYGNTIFRVELSEPSESGDYVKVKDRFGNEYTQEVTITGN